jgi:3-oxoadipate enol-lactonase
MKAAIRGGVPLDLIKETLMQGAIYCGVPAANTGFKLTMDALREMGLLPAPQPLSAAARVATHHTFSQPQLKVAVQGVGLEKDASGTPIVLSHALGLDLHMWDDLAAQLAADRPVLRYDHRGHGGSAVPAGPYTMDELVDDAARLIREWGRGPVVWVGLSMGGMVGMGLAIRHPELIEALVLANTSSKYPEAAAAVFAQRIGAVQNGGLAAIVDSVLERYFSAAFRANEPEAVAVARGTVLRSDPVGYAAACAAVGGVNWLDRLNTIRCPTLIIAGKLDVGAPVSMSEAMAERIKGSQLVVFDEASHLSVAEQPAQFAQTLQAFLKKVS